ncbi:MaoC family dehydratase N-terminal domain-containing protein [Phenylobacterium sp.]|uniref:FAS1-like dehydratase domain-containing protein n=1 Tax=Phenylobacterium sp. TaxID=1871053 RepID=UPI00301C6045
MSETAIGVNPKGIFDRHTKGRVLASVAVEVERGRIQFFSQVLGVKDPIHFDVASARAAGHSDIVAPPSFFTVIDATVNEERARRGEPSAASLVKVDYRYLLHGDETYEYFGPIFAGDEVSLTTTVADFYDKKGGEMEFVTLISELRHAERGVLVRATRNLLHRLP